MALCKKATALLALPDGLGSQAVDEARRDQTQPPAYAPAR